MELVITENDVKYIENNVRYILISNYKKEERYMGNIAAKVAKLTTAKWAEAYNILGNIIPDYIGLYVKEEEWEDNEKINNFLASYLVIKDELRKRDIPEKEKVINTIANEHLKKNITSPVEISINNVKRETISLLNLK